MFDRNADESARCLWCGQMRTDLRRLEVRPEPRGPLATLRAPLRVCGEHELQLDTFMRRVPRRSASLLVSILTGTPLLVAGGVIGNDYLALSGVVLVGVALVAFPLATPETVGRIGVQRSVRLVRWLGSAIAAISVAAMVGIALGIR